MYTPLRLTIPFDLKWVFNKFGISDWYWYFYGDLPGLKGGTMYSNRNPQGFPISPEHPMSWYREHIDQNYLIWGYATRPGAGTWFCNMVLPDTTYQFVKLHLNIDEGSSNPPEDVPGEVAGGALMNFKDVDPGLWLFMAPGTYTIGLETFFASPGLEPPQVPEWTNIRAFPVQADVTRRAFSPAGQAAPREAEKGGPGLCQGGQAVVITNLQGRQTRLCDAKFHIGDMQATGWDYALGQEVGTRKWFRVDFHEMQRLEQVLGAQDPITGMEHPMMARITRRDGSRLELMGCKSCVLSGCLPDGRKQGYLATEIRAVDFLEPGQSCEGAPPAPAAGSR